MIDPPKYNKTRDLFKNYLSSAAEIARGKSSWTTVKQLSGTYTNHYADGYYEHEKLWKELEEQSKEAIKKNLEDPSFTLKMVRDMLKANARLKPFVEKWERARGIILDEHIHGIVESAEMTLMKFKYLDLYPINLNGTCFIPSEYLLNDEDKKAKYVSYNRVRKLTQLDGKELRLNDLDTYHFIQVYRDRDGKLKVLFEYPQVLQPVIEMDKAFQNRPVGKAFEANNLNGMKAEFEFHGAQLLGNGTPKVRKMCVNAELLAYLFKSFNMTFEYKKTVQTPEELKAELEKFDAYLGKIDTIRNTIQSTADKWNELAEEFQALQDKLIAAANNIKDFATASENKVKKTIEILGAADYIDTFEKDDSNY